MTSVPSLESGLAVDVVHADGDWTAFSAIDGMISRVAAAVAEDIADGVSREACVCLSSDAAVRGLNRTYRGKDQPTNVLSFAAPRPPGTRPPGEPAFLGDVALAIETIRAEAAALAIPPEHHLQHLIVHGLLHLLGYDHETSEADAREMESREVAILARLGIPDPYANGDVHDERREGGPMARRKDE